MRVIDIRPYGRRIRLCACIALGSATLLLSGCGKDSAEQVTPPAATQEEPSQGHGSKYREELAASEAKDKEVQERKEQDGTTPDSDPVDEGLPYDPSDRAHGIATLLVNEIEYTDEMNLLEDSVFDYLYPEVDKADIEKYTIYYGSGATSEEAVGIEAVDEAAAERVEEGLRYHIAEQSNMFKDYAPEEVKKLNNSVLVRDGKFVFLSVSSHPDEAGKIISMK